MAPTRAVQAISFLVTIILLLGISPSQRFFVLAGGILGTSISRSYFKPSKRTYSAASRDLVSIDDAASNQCISLKTTRCGNTVVGQWQREYSSRHGELGSCKLNEIQMALGTMANLRLCKRCQENSTALGYIDNYIKEWSIEVQQKLLTGDIPSISTETEADVPCSEGPTISSSGSSDGPFPRVPAAPHVPGDYPESPAPQLLPHTAHRGRRGSIMQPTASNSKARQVSSPAKLIDGWRLVPFDCKDEPGKTFKDGVFAKLEKKELEAGLIYILSREQDETYYKVGYTVRDMKSRLKEHNDVKKCNGNWKSLWSKKVKHAKRVEKLILLEFGLRGLQYQESWCKTGGDNCTRQHKEIIKASFETVKACVEHWITWMTDYHPYEQRPSAQSYSCNPNAEASSSTWEFAQSYFNKTNDVNDDFGKISTGQSWAQPFQQPRNKPRSKSTSVMVKPMRPKLAEQTREVQSEKPADHSRYDLRSHVRQDGRHPTPTPTPSPRASRSVQSGTPDGVETTGGPQGHSPDLDMDVDRPDARATKNRMTPKSRAGHSRTSRDASLKEGAEQNYIEGTNSRDNSDQDDSAAEAKEDVESGTDSEQGGSDDEDDSETSHIWTGASTRKTAKQKNSWDCQHCGRPIRFLQKFCSQCRTPREIVDLTLDNENMRAEVHNDLDERGTSQGQGPSDRSADKQAPQ